MSTRFRFIPPLLLLLLLLALAWFQLTAHPQITGLRNLVHYQLVTWLGGPTVRAGELAGTLAGTVTDDQGQPVAGALVLVSSPIGHTFLAESGPDGAYRLAGLPPGRYVPVAGKRGYDDALPQDCVAGLCWKDTVAVHSGREAQAPDLALEPIGPLPVVVDDSLIVSPTTEVEVGAPFPSRSRRTHFSFERAGLRVNDCWLYEPVDGSGPLPTLLLVLPGPVKGWEIIPVPFAAQDFSVVACYPLRGIDIDADAADLMTALEYVRLGRVPSRADPERLVLVGASFTSLHTYRLLALTDRFDVTLVLGGMADGLSFRRDVETGVAEARDPFDQVLIALGLPHTSPEQYFRYSVLFHLDGLPPMCLLHGHDDELVPFSQSLQLAAELDRRGMPHELYTYPGLAHYFSTRADNATTQQMLQDALGCMRRFLAAPR